MPDEQRAAELIDFLALNEYMIIDLTGRYSDDEMRVANDSAERMGSRARVLRGVQSVTLTYTPDGGRQRTETIINAKEHRDG